ncbi:MAG: hypothetical protein A4E60_02446 [Syntrophorhabdus sp. PtaB.Bin047]|jgi:hypothetical protein|nr:MAG: hypothetical protein A4E60_02446 [Syntrophorhabdus sp. PtaB.Bin047]
MRSFSVYILFLFLFNISLFLFLVVGLFRINEKEGFFYRALTPVETPPEKIRDMINNRRVLTAAGVLLCFLWFWLTGPFPDYSWSGFFLLSLYHVLAISFLCFRRLSPGQFVLVCSTLNISVWIEPIVSLMGSYTRIFVGSSVGELAVLPLFSTMSLTIVYFVNRCVLSRMFRSERVSAVIAVVALLLLEFRSFILLIDLSYRFKGL